MGILEAVCFGFITYVVGVVVRVSKNDKQVCTSITCR